MTDSTPTFPDPELEQLLQERRLEIQALALGLGLTGEQRQRLTRDIPPKAEPEPATDPDATAEDEEKPS